MYHCLAVLLINAIINLSGHCGKTVHSVLNTFQDYNQATNPFTQPQGHIDVIGSGSEVIITGGGFAIATGCWDCKVCMVGEGESLRTVSAMSCRGTSRLAVQRAALMSVWV